MRAQCTSPLETHSNQRTTCARSVCGWFASLSSHQRCTIIKCPLTNSTRSHIVPRSAMSSPSNTLHLGSNRLVATKRVFRQLSSSDRMSSALTATGCPPPLTRSRVQRDRSFTKWDTLLRAMERVLLTGVTRHQSSRRGHRVWPCSSKPVVCPASSQTSNVDSLPFGRSSLDWRMQDMLLLASPRRTTLRKPFLLPVSL